MASPSTNAGSTAWPLAASASTISTETARKTGNQALGVMKIADSASAVPMSVTKQALMMSLPIRDWLSPVSTSTAYTTASDVVDFRAGEERQDDRRERRDEHQPRRARVEVEHVAGDDAEPKLEQRHREPDLDGDHARQQHHRRQHRGQPDGAHDARCGRRLTMKRSTALPPRRGPDGVVEAIGGGPGRPS